MSEPAFNLTHAIGGVPPERLDAVWPRLAPLMRQLFARSGMNDWSLAGIWDALKSGSMQLWIVDNFVAAIGTSVQVRDRRSVLFVDFLVGSRMKDWLDDWIVVMEAFARHNECEAIEFRGRRGWRLFERYHRDYKPAFTIYRKEL